MKMEKWKQRCASMWKSRQKNSFFDLFSYFSTGKLLWKKMWKSSKTDFLHKGPQKTGFLIVSPFFPSCFPQVLGHFSQPFPKFPTCKNPCKYWRFCTFPQFPHPLLLLLLFNISFFHSFACERKTKKKIYFGRSSALRKGKL